MATPHSTPPRPGGGTVDSQQLRQAVVLLHALNHSLRQGIIELLADGARLTVTEIFTALRIEQSVASQHLAILRAARLVAPERDGKYIYYTLVTDRLSRLQNLVVDLSHLSDETTG